MARYRGSFHSMKTTNEKIIELTEFTYPVCTWCWGSEPVLRKLETRFGEPVKISYIMGGLVQDITSFYDSYNDIGGDPVRSNKNIAKHWVDASARQVPQRAILQPASGRYRVGACAFLRACCGTRLIYRR